MNSRNILVVEDEEEIALAIKTYLTNQNYKTFIAHNGVEGLDILQKEEIHLAIVDVMMPIMDGITFVMKLREKHHFPVIMLSARSEDIDKVMGLNIGADDYITKPFQVLELLARVNSHIRRYEKYLDVVQQEKISKNILLCGGLELNQDTKEVSVDGKQIRLTPREFSILSLLMEHEGKVFSAEDIYENVWNEVAVNTDTIMEIGSAHV